MTPQRVEFTKFISDMFKTQVVVKVSNTSLDDLSVSKVSLWSIRTGKSHPPLSSLHFKKVTFQTEFIFTESITALYQVKNKKIKNKKGFMCHKWLFWAEQSFVTHKSFFYFLFFYFWPFQTFFAPVSDLENTSHVTTSLCSVSSHPPQDKHYTHSQVWNGKQGQLSG